MKHLVIVPGWRRPDFLAATLTCLERAMPLGTSVWLCLDRGSTTEVHGVMNRFMAAHDNTRVRTVRHRFRGNSYNVLTAYREAYLLESPPDIVHLIEEDIFIGCDYFAFHERAHTLCPDVLAVSACRNQNVEERPAPDPHAIIRHLSYQSLGVSFRPAMLGHVVLHVRPEYFADPTGYCQRMFPRYQHGTAFAEQDGMIRRIGEALGLPAAYPAVPRAYHAGFHGYNRNGARARFAPDQLLRMDSCQLNALARSHPDHETIDLWSPRPELSYAIA